MKKIFTSIFLALALLVMTAGIAFAQETTPITGTVQTVAIEVNETTGENIVVVTLLDETGASQTIRVSLETAEALGLVTTDPTTGETLISEGVAGTAIEIDPTTILPEDNTEEDQHPVGSSLSNFFGDLLGVDYETIMSYHNEGVGFGVIAQALWLSNSLGGGSETFSALIEAKKSGDYSNITLADGTTPDNWGDVVKSLKQGENLGSVMSGRATNNETGEPSTNIQKPNKKDKKDNGNGNANGNNSVMNGNNNGNGNSSAVIGNSANNNVNGGGNGNGNGNNGNGGNGGGGNGNGGNGNGNGH